MGVLRQYRVHVYVWGKGGSAPRPKAPMILTYLREHNPSSPGYWKTITVTADDGRRAKLLAQRKARKDLKDLGLYKPLSRCNDGISKVLVRLTTPQ